MLMDEYFSQERPGPARQREGRGRRRRGLERLRPPRPRRRLGHRRLRDHPVPRLRPRGADRARVSRSPGALAASRRRGTAAEGRPDAEGAARGPPSFEFCEPGRFDARFDAFWRELVAQNPTTVARASATPRLCGGTTAFPLRAARLWIVTAPRNGLIRAYCVLKQHLRPRGLRSMKIVDFQTRRARHRPAPRPRQARTAAGGRRGLRVARTPRLRVAENARLRDHRPYRAAKPAGPSTTPPMTRRWRHGWPTRDLGPVGVRRRLQLQVRPPIGTVDDVPSGRVRTHTG